MRFNGKRVLVTGAAAGIGRAVAMAFAAEGAQLIAADRDDAGLRDLARTTDARTLAYDALAPGEGQAMVATAGPIDVLVNVAGIYSRAHFDRTPDADWDRVLRVNLTSVFEICRAALPALARPGGVIVNTASTAGLKGIAYAAPYAASKAGVIALTRSLAAEYGHLGLRVNAVAPGRVLTGIGKDLAPLQDAIPALGLHRAKLAGLEDGAPPEALSGVYLWLASEAAAYVSGAVQVVDGAYMCG